MAERWRTLAHRFRGAEASSQTPAILKYNLEAHCVCAGWLLIDGFTSEALPLRDEWRAEMEHCVSSRESDGGIARSNKATGNFFRGIVAGWLIREMPDRVRHTPCLTVSVGPIVPIPQGKTAVEAIRDADQSEPLEVSTGIDKIKVGDDWIDASPQSAETWADACDVLTVLVGDSAAVQRHVEDDELPAVDDEEIRLLLCLNQRATRLQKTDYIRGWTRLGKRAVTTGLNRLIGLGLAERSKGANGGATITPKGRALLIRDGTTRAPK